VLQYRRNISYLKLAGFVLVPVVLLLLPANQFDTGQSLCVSKLLLNRECYGCGITRAIMHLIHLDVNQALHYNKLSVVVFPLLSFLWVQSFWKELAKHRP
jgi:hypothetical protein